MCVIDFIDHCEIILIHFAKLKDFKNKYLKAKTFTQSVIESHNPRKLCSFNRERNQMPAWYQLIFTVKQYSLSQSNNKIFQMQCNVLRNLYHAQNSLLRVDFPQSFFFSIFYIHHFICPFREQPPVSSDLLPFPLIKYNSIPYTFIFLLKTWILLSFSNHELYFISSLCRLLNINHPKLFFHLHFYSL